MIHSATSGDWDDFWSGPIPDQIPSIFSNKMTVNRDELQEKYIQWDLNQMSVDDLKQFFVDTQNRELGDLDDDELIEEVESYAPNLLN